jgi:monosaccharide-transporting ATPase
VLLISSEVDELLEGSDRIVVLKDGRVVDHLDGDDVNETSLMNALAVEADLGG